MLPCCLVYFGSLSSLHLVSLLFAGPQIYRNEGVRIAVVDVITWTTSNQIQIVDDPEASLNNFQKGALNLSQIYDSAMLLTYVQLKSKYFFNIV